VGDSVSTHGPLVSGADAAHARLAAGSRGSSQWVAQRSENRVSGGARYKPIAELIDPRSLNA
jgi:hypothetical protein